MAESKLLKEAIADAKAVRETAIANAKLALEEAFTPKLQSMLSKKIEEEAEDTDEDELEEQSDSSGLGKGDNKVDQVDGDDYEKAETEKSSAAPGSEDGNLKVVDKLTESEDDMDEDEDPEEMHDMEEDLDLEEIIRELEEEDEEEKTEMAYKEDEDMEETEDMDEGSYKEDEDMEETEDMDETEETEDMDEDIDLDEIIKSLQEEDDDEEVNENDELESKEEELEEAYSTIRSLKATINEVNLLNAKLLFSNKLFKSHNLTEGQKMKIIETLDRAQNTREVKLVYSTLAESLGSGATKKATIKEGIASRATKSTAPAKEVIVETNQFSGRMKKLAGLL